MSFFMMILSWDALNCLTMASKNSPSPPVNKDQNVISIGPSAFFCSGAACANNMFETNNATATTNRMLFLMWILLIKTHS